MNLNRPLLLELYTDWTKRWGSSRNDEGIRFGQWVWINWNSELTECRERFSSPDSLLDGFYAESPKTAYEQIYRLLPH
jgi:hypothetical protein